MANTKITKTCANFKVSSSDSQSLKSEISKTISAASKNMLEQAFLDNINFAFYKQLLTHFIGNLETFVLIIYVFDPGIHVS